MRCIVRALRPPYASIGSSVACNRGGPTRRAERWAGGRRETTRPWRHDALIFPPSHAALGTLVEGGHGLVGGADLQPARIVGERQQRMWVRRALTERRNRGFRIFDFRFVRTAGSMLVCWCTLGNSARDSKTLSKSAGSKRTSQNDFIFQFTHRVCLIGVFPRLGTSKHVIHCLVLQRHFAAHCRFQIVNVWTRLTVEAQRAIGAFQQQQIAARRAEMHGLLLNGKPR